MKTIENVTIYKCDFCKKELKRKHAMIKHEDLCNNNPKNFKACNGCVHCELVETSWFTDETDYMTPREVKSNKLHCKKLDIFMFPFKVEKKGYHLKYDTFDGQVPMPNKCEFQEDIHNINWV
ncbi:MAG TPA: hypothetical protein VIK86_06375 [Candidatus Paceibacterota bacterium]